MQLGEKIKQLRQKSGMTQEQLARKLNVTNQTVSKWETGTASPDLSLIVPIARLFGVTTDELFDYSETADKLRREELEKQYKETFKTGDLQVRLAVCEQAVKEFPADMKWQADYAWDIWCCATEALKGKEFADAREKAIGIFKTVIDGTCEDQTKRYAINGIVQCLCSAGRKAEALAYAEKFQQPAPIGASKAELEAMCLEGEEKKKLSQQILYEHLNELFRSLCYLDLGFEVQTDTAIALVKLFIPDGNYFNFGSELAFLYGSKAKLLCDAGKIEEAEEALRNACKCAEDFDAIEGKYTYTAPLFDLVTYNRDDWCITGQTTAVEDLKKMLDHPNNANVRKLNAYKEFFKPEDE